MTLLLEGVVKGENTVSIYLNMGFLGNMLKVGYKVDILM